MASSPAPSQLEEDDNNNNNNNNNNSSDTSPPPPITTSNDTNDDVSLSPSTSPTPDQSPPPPSSSPPPESPTPPPPAPPPPEASPPPPDAAPPPPPSDDPSPPPPADDPSPPPPDAAASPPPPPADSPPPPPTSPSPPPPANSTAPRGSPPTKGSPPPPPASFSPPPPGSLSSQTPPPRQPSGREIAGGSNTGNPSPPSDSSSNVAIIAGAIVGGIAILALVIICLLCSRKKKKQRYYADPGLPPPKGGDNQFYNNDPTQWQSPQPGDQIVNLPPPPGFMAAPVPTSGTWGGPPPPQMANTSSEFSSGYSGPHPPSPSIGTNMSQFRYDDLLAATGGFSQANLLGQGGFGYVHKGILPNKREVAVKSLKTGSGQGEREFQAEVEIISRVHHRHLVSLVGYCIASEQRLLVYEYVGNKTLEFHLHGKGQPVMAWSTRLKIAIGSAKGLAYLHEDCHPRIIHRDIKAANILLDNNFEAMVADFGLAKLTSDNYTHVSTRVMGTFGYLAPEYASSGKLTEKSDVFSFGVMLLELITGRRPVDTTNKTMEDSLVDWARPLLSKAIEDSNYNELVDPRLEGNYVTRELSSMVACAAASIRHSARRRPKMSQIAHALEGDSTLDDLNEGVKPGDSKAYNPSGTGGEAYDTRAYNADMLKFKKMVMSSEEFNSGEYGTTSEYGQYPSSSSGDSSREILKANAGIKKTYT